MAEGAPWYVVHIAPARDDVVARGLRRLGCEVYNPRIVESHYGRLAKYVIRDDAYFPGYLLFRVALTDDLWYRIDRLPNVIRILTDDGRPGTIRDCDIERVRRDVARRSAPPKREALPRGAELMITDGALAGQPAVHEETVGDRITLLIDMFGRKVVAKGTDTRFAVVA